MIGKLRGKVAEINADNIIVDVSGLGYIVYVNNKVINRISLNEEMSFFIIHAIYENGMRLYGFLCKEEQQCAEILSKVKGISYKITLSILNSFSPSEIRDAILSKNSKLLHVPGVGDKLASRIVAELYDAMTQFLPSDLSTEIHAKIIEDAASILINLGYGTKNVFFILHEILKNNQELGLSDLIKLALRDINKINLT